MRAVLGTTGGTAEEHPPHMGGMTSMATAMGAGGMTMGDMTTHQGVGTMVAGSSKAVAAAEVMVDAVGVQGEAVRGRWIGIMPVGLITTRTNQPWALCSGAEGGVGVAECIEDRGLRVAGGLGLSCVLPRHWHMTAAEAHVQETKFVCLPIEL